MSRSHSENLGGMSIKPAVSDSAFNYYSASTSSLSSEKDTIYAGEHDWNSQDEAMLLNAINKSGGSFLKRKLEPDTVSESLSCIDEVTATAVLAVLQEYSERESKTISQNLNSTGKLIQKLEKAVDKV